MVPFVEPLALLVPLQHNGGTQLECLPVWWQARGQTGVYVLYRIYNALHRVSTEDSLLHKDQVDMSVWCDYREDVSRDETE